MYTVDVAGRETVLYSFLGGARWSEPIRGFRGPRLGWQPVRDPPPAGVVYKVDTSVARRQFYTTSRFRGFGEDPEAGLIRDSSLVIYTELHLVAAQRTAGVVYKLDAAGQETVLHNFTRAAPMGAPPGGWCDPRLGRQPLWDYCSRVAWLTRV